jgi:hypothetical protein
MEDSRMRNGRQQNEKWKTAERNMEDRKGSNVQARSNNSKKTYRDLIKQK